jgi:hypothetical protein
MNRYRRAERKINSKGYFHRRINELSKEIEFTENEDIIQRLERKILYYKKKL